MKDTTSTAAARAFANLAVIAKARRDALESGQPYDQAELDDQDRAIARLQAEIDQASQEGQEVCTAS